MKTLEFFAINRRSKDGRFAYCRKCSGMRSKSWREAHPGHASEYGKTYHAEHKEKSRTAYFENHEANLANRAVWRDANPDYFSRYYQANKEVSKARSAQWVKENRERARLTRRQWVQNNQEKVREGKRRAKYVRRSRSELESEPYSRLDICERDEWMCQICMESVDASIGDPVDPGYPNIDHKIPLSKGGRDAPSNVQLTHRLCNIRKGVS